MQKKISFITIKKFKFYQFQFFKEMNAKNYLQS